MGFVDLNEDLSKYPERVPPGYYRKEKPPKGFFPAVSWRIKRRPRVALSIVALPVLIVIALVVAKVTFAEPAPGGPSERRPDGVSRPEFKSEGDGVMKFQTESVELKFKTPDGKAQDPNYTRTRKTEPQPLPVPGSGTDRGY